MSTKMFNFVVPKATAWTALAALREHAHWESPLAEGVRAICWDDFTNGERRLEQWDKFRKTDLARDLSLELQLFDMARAPTVQGYEMESWMVRPLERGWWLYAAMEKMTPFTRCTYCDSTDVPSEDQKNRVLAKWLDAEIDAGNYFLHNLVDVERYNADVVFLHW